MDENNKSSNTLNIGIELETNNMVRKLRTISTHITALVKDLEEIDEVIINENQIAGGIEPNDCEDTPLLQVTLDKIDSVPRVYLSGKRIKGLHNFNMDWMTKTDNHNGISRVLVDYYNEELERIVFKEKK
jgi:hypothetical protein